MAIMSSAVAGCCAAQNLYNLGGQHGAPAAKSQEEFDIWLRARGMMRVNIALTNNYQQRERGYLEAAGFKTEKVSGRIWLSWAPYDVVIKYLTSRKAALEEYTNKKKIDKEKKSAFRRLARGNDGIYNGVVYLHHVADECRNVHPRNQSFADLRNTAERINDRYPGVNITVNMPWRYYNVTDFRRYIAGRLYRARENARLARL